MAILGLTLNKVFYKKKKVSIFSATLPLALKGWKFPDPHTLKGWKLLVPHALKGWKFPVPHALKGQKLLAQGIALGMMCASLSP